MNFRIITIDENGKMKIKFAGTGQDSWFTLEQARLLVEGEDMIYEFSTITGNRLWEVL